MGFKKAVMITRLIHASFHLPLLLSGKYHSERNPFIQIPLFFISVMMIAIVYGYVRQRSGSVWPAAIIHASNNFWAVFKDFTHVNSNAFLNSNKV
jgi:membrane protease YdiL (CAAX protease family)